MRSEDFIRAWDRIAGNPHLSSVERRARVSALAASTPLAARIAALERQLGLAPVASRPCKRDRKMVRQLARAGWPIARIAAVTGLPAADILEALSR